MKERIKQIREHFGLSQSQFAMKINKTPSFIANVETGRSSISENTVQSICDVFVVNKDWLMNGTGPMFKNGVKRDPADKEGIGARLRTVRKEYGLTQDQFAERVGYSKTQVHYAEKGRVIPSNVYISKVATAFHISIEWLMSGEGNMVSDLNGDFDDSLMQWLKSNPDVVSELRRRAGLA